MAQCKECGGKVSRSSRFGICQKCWNRPVTEADIDKGTPVILYVSRYLGIPESEIKEVLETLRMSIRASSRRR